MVKILSVSTKTITTLISFFRVFYFYTFETIEHEILVRVHKDVISKYSDNLKKK